MTTGGAAVWAGSSRGYSAAEMRAKAEDGTLAGVSKWDLDTPALCVDLDKFESNIATMRAKLTAMHVVSRPHGKSHKCPAVAKLQLAGGSIGICTAKVSEAEAMFDGGIEPLLMTTSNVTKNKIARAMTLRKKNPRFIQAVDHPQRGGTADPHRLEADHYVRRPAVVGERRRVPDQCHEVPVAAEEAAERIAAQPAAGLRCGIIPVEPLLLAVAPQPQLGVEPRGPL